MALNRALPGMSPRFVQMKLHNRGHWCWDLHVWQGDAEGLVRADEMDHYEALTPAEVLDVLLAVVEGATGL